MFLRPTSETAMYTMFPLWIRSQRFTTQSLPNGQTFRYETKQTRSFIRVREIHFFEAHTAHADEADATRQIEQDLEIVDRLMDKLCLPIIKAKRPVWDTFPGAHYTIGIDAVMPNGRTLQVAVAIIILINGQRRLISPMRILMRSTTRSSNHIWDV